MDIGQRTLTFMSALLKSYGPTSVKKRLWDEEFSGDKWDFIDNTVGDCVYGHLEKYAANGTILDLGCGPGNTANELAESAYARYVGVDISEAALRKATNRTAQCGRASKNSFVCADFVNYEPDQQFQVILFRESMYHVPLGKVKETLDHYSKYLTPGGVFIVRMKTASIQGGSNGRRPRAMIGVIQANFKVVENCYYPEAGSTVIVFQPRLDRHA